MASGMRLGPVEHDEPLHAQALGEDGAEILRPRRGFGGGIARDQTAERDATMDVHLQQDRVEDVAADVFEVDVDAVGAGSLEAGCEIAGLVVDAGIEAEFVGDVARTSPDRLRCRPRGSP